MQKIPMFADKQIVLQVLGLKGCTLKRWRIGDEKRGIPAVLREGIHWVRQNPRHSLYHVPLLQDFIANRANPEAHDRAIASFLESLPSSQAPAKKRRAA